MAVVSCLLLLRMQGAIQGTTSSWNCKNEAGTSRLEGACLVFVRAGWPILWKPSDKKENGKIAQRLMSLLPLSLLKASSEMTVRMVMMVDRAAAVP